MFKYLVYFLLLLGMSGSANADECTISNDDSPGTLTLTGGAPGTIQMFVPTDINGGSGDRYTELSYFDPNLSREVWSHCSNGSDGVALYAYTNQASAVASTDGRALFPTNIDGIYYAVKFYSTGGGGGYFPSSLNTWTVIDPGSEAKWDEKILKITVTLYQRGNFGGNVNNVAYITPKDSRTLGQMRIGESDTSGVGADNFPWSINVTPASFSVPIVAATCSTAVESSGTNNVDFGDIMFSSLREGHWPTKPFSLKLSGCNNTVFVRFKLSSPKTDSSGGLTNTLTGSNAAQGIGVTIYPEFLTMDGAAAWLSPGTELWAPSSSVDFSQTYTYDFTAYMQRNNETLTPGQFKAIGTFTMDYF